MGTFERAATRGLARLCFERRGLTLGHLDRAVRAFRRLPDERRSVTCARWPKQPPDRVVRVVLVGDFAGCDLPSPNAPPPPRLPCSGSVPRVRCPGFGNGSLRRFRVADNGDTITLAYTVCTRHSHTVRVRAYLKPENRSRPTVTATFRNGQSRGCRRYRVRGKDLPTGRWRGAVKVRIGEQIRRSDWRWLLFEGD